MTTRDRDQRAAWALAAAATLLLLVGLGWTDLWAPDEARIGQIAEELRSMRHGAPGLVLLHANGEPYTQKPPLYYWLAAGFGSALGEVTEVAARLPSALAGLACIAITVVFGRALFADPRAGLCAGALLLGVFRFAHLTRRAQLDPLLSLFEVGALLAFWRIESGRGSRLQNLVALHAALGLAVLTKGPVGLLALAGIAAYLVWEGRGRELRALLPVWSPLLALLPALLWLAGASLLAAPGFFGEAVVDNLFGRFVAGSSHARPAYYFAIQFPLDFLPFTLLWPLALTVVWPRLRGPAGSGDRKDPERGALRLLVAWILVCLVFFSLSAGKRGLYLLPIFPATALLCGYALALRLREGAALRGAFAVATAVAGLLFAAGVWLGSSPSGVEVPNNPGFVVPASFGWALATIAGLSLLLQAGLLRLGSGPQRRLAAWWAAVVALYASVFWLAYPAFDEQKSPRPVALAALAQSHATAAIGVFDQRALVEAVAYYADRKVLHFMEPAEALDFLAEPGHALIVRADKLDRLRSSGRIQVLDSLRAGRRELLVVGGSPEQRRSGVKQP